MGIKQIDVATFLKYLKHLGLVHVRTESSHHIYDYPESHPNGKLKRPIVVRPKYKDIPLLHIHTNLKNAGVSKEDFELWLKSPKRK